MTLCLIIILWMWLRRKSRRRKTTHEKISKPLFLEDDVSYHVSPSSAHGVRYTSLSATGSDPTASSYGTPSINTSAFLAPGAAIDIYNPYMAQSTTSGDINSTPNPSSYVSAPLTASMYSTGLGTSSSVRNEYDQQSEPRQPVAYVRNPDQLVPDLNRSSAASNNTPSAVSLGSQNHQVASYLEKEREAFSSASPSASGSGSSGGQDRRPIVTSPDVEPELPPPAYES